MRSRKNNVSCALLTGLGAICAVLFFSGCDEELLRQYSFLKTYYANEEQSALASHDSSQEQESSADTSPQQDTVSDLAMEIPECPILEETEPRGLACMHCLEPSAGPQAKVIIFLLLKSCLRNIAINYLVDGSFSFDEELLKEHIALLTQGNRRLFLHLYLTNGASQRSWESTEVPGFATRMSPDEFRRQIFVNKELQSQYQQLITRLVPVMRFALERNAVVSLIPSLEDNLSDRAFEALYQLTLAAIPADIPVSIGRNPCPNCYDGNGSSVPSGVFLEQHAASPHISVEDGLVTNDGHDYYLENDYSPRSARSVALRDLEAIRDRAAEKNNVFILWSAKRQGINVNARGEQTFLPPKDRIYPVPDIKEREIILKFLRAGLEE